MLRPTTEYFIKTCLFCYHDLQQNADWTNNRMYLFCCHDQQQNADTTNNRMHSVVGRVSILLLLAVAYSVVDQMDNLHLYPVLRSK